MTLELVALIIALFGAAALGAALYGMIHSLRDIRQLKYEQQMRKLRAMRVPPPKASDIHMAQEIKYIENTLKQLIAILKRNDCIDRDFDFKTNAEREAYVEKVLNDFLVELDKDQPNTTEDVS